MLGYLRMLVVALPILLGACASMPAAWSGANSAAPGDTLIAPARRIVMPQPAELGRTVEARQLVTVKHNGTTVVFESRISITPTRMTFVGMDTLGRRAMSVEWDGKKMDVELASWVPPTLRPGSMMADLAMIYWPEASAKAAFASTGGDITVAGRQRIFRIDGKEILRAQYDWVDGAAWNGKLHYANLAWGYEVDVQSVEIKPEIKRTAGYKG